MRDTDGCQRHTFGGVCFALAKQRIAAKLGRKATLAIFPPRRPDTGATHALVIPQEGDFVWSDRLGIASELAPQQGEARTVKVTLIGCPGNLVTRGASVMTSVRSGKAPALPKGVPEPPRQSTLYVVYIASK